MDLDYIIIQSGGKGTRLYPYTKNKPKAIVAVNNRPIIFNIFNKFPDKKFIIIGDYKYNELFNYLNRYAPVKYISVHTKDTGNVAGIKDALKYIPENKGIMLIWSDLLLDSTIDFSNLSNDSYVGITNSFKCSWQFKDNKLLQKIQTSTNGVAGMFIFKNKKLLSNVPQSGSFTQWLSQKIDADNTFMHSLDLLDTREVGSITAIKEVDKSEEHRCRPYNKLIFEKDKVTKKGLTEDAQKLIVREANWYKSVIKNHFSNIPYIYSYDQLIMEKIKGNNIFKTRLDNEQKKNVIDKIIEALNKLHSFEQRPCNYFDMQEDYFNKTMKRIRGIRDVIPFSNQDFININGKKCRNVLFYANEFQEKILEILDEDIFGIIHGDCTLTNTMIDEDGKIYFIDARGYFGKTELIGDPYYDWAKIYYSINGCFDQFNIKNFDLNIGEYDIQFKIAPSEWEYLTDYFFSKIPNCNIYKIKLIHAIIWLSLASHCWEDYDSLCLAFYNGLYLLNELGY